MMLQGQEADQAALRPGQGPLRRGRRVEGGLRRRRERAIADRSLPTPTLISELNELSAQRTISEGGFNQGRTDETGDFRTPHSSDADKQAERRSGSAGVALRRCRLPSGRSTGRRHDFEEDSRERGGRHQVRPAPPPALDTPRGRRDSRSPRPAQGGSRPPSSTGSEMAAGDVRR